MPLPWILSWLAVVLSMNSTYLIFSELSLSLPPKQEKGGSHTMTVTFHKMPW